MTWRKKHEKLANIKILLVGAGGIGCELLKNLALTGFKKIDVIDLDTIDVSNLNRQFLFRREHVGQPKAKIAAEAVKSFCPSVEINYYHDSIFSEQFNLSYFSQFQIVINALDNKAARTHVNRMCLAAKIPLIDSGSSGYVGQVTVIVRQQTECYECVPKDNAQKTYPGCTIRNTPSELIHCIVWAKHLFNQLFGEIDIDDDVSPDVTDTNGKEDDSNGEEQTDAKEKTPQPSTRQWAESVEYDSVKLFDKLFFADINYLCSMDHLWKQRKRPVPLTYSAASQQEKGATRRVKDILEDYNSVWTLQECAAVFCDCVQLLSERKKKLDEGDILVWDKDDEDAMAFVASCANIRATIFNIIKKSLFEIKSMAGNIIPAIATTNAIVSAVTVREAITLAYKEFHEARNNFVLEYINCRGQVVGKDVPNKPNPNCYVCSDKRECIVMLNPQHMTVKAFNDRILKNSLSMLAPDVTDVINNRIIISSEGDTDAINCKKLSELSIGDGAILCCDDFQQDLELKLIITGCADLRGDEFEILQTGKEEPSEETRKRKADEENGNGAIESEQKRPRVAV
ncbi:unnamed protein product [Caenorhabditis bovis]|uniref:SUMO-activating enzyme subunit n=1 Tax=Caenorhabditis bovis TaxID=2654633 RepID=A0A8S1F6R5_9PELO|nr:unnamed protein product [Caenorhabditis bovis]